VVENFPGGAGAGGSAGNGNPAAAAGPAGAQGGGGGILAGSMGSITVANTLLALNASGNCGATPGGTIGDGAHNLSFGGGGCPASFATGDPKLGALEDNGGPTQTISLGPGSAAIDQIPGGPGCTGTDQRGVPRPSGAGCDIGAYEVAPPVASVVRGAEVPRAGGKRAVQIVARVTPNSGRARVWVEYGRTRRYGRRSAVHVVGGVTPAKVAIKLSGLKLPGTYHYRVVVSTVDGTRRSGDRRLVVPVRGVAGRRPRPARGT
jgi:hypothetical protein